jgi:antirestriction protein ArdC
MDTNPNPPAEPAHKDVYAIVTDKIIDQLHKGIVPWRQPWKDSGIPRNLVSNRPYRGINVMLLSFLGYEQNYFLTYKQLKDIGGSLKQGEKGHMVVYWNFFEKQIEKVSEGSNPKKIPNLRYYTVYNISQCIGVQGNIPPFETIEVEPIMACEKILAEMPKKPVIQYKEQRAWYNPVSDLVNMPKAKTFVSMESYYATLFHELVHSTGHISRLDRKDLLQMSELGSDAYSHEELVAEIGTCYLQSFAGVTGYFEESVGYIQGWLKRLQNDRRFIFSAANHAQKATDFILGTGNEPEDMEQK